MKAIEVCNTNHVLREIVDVYERSLHEVDLVFLRRPHVAVSSILDTTMATLQHMNQSFFRQLRDFMLPNLPRRLDISTSVFSGLSGWLRLNLDQRLLKWSDEDLLESLNTNSLPLCHGITAKLQSFAFRSASI